MTMTVEVGWARNDHRSKQTWWGAVDVSNDDVSLSDFSLKNIRDLCVVKILGGNRNARLQDLCLSPNLPFEIPASVCVAFFSNPNGYT